MSASHHKDESHPACATGRLESAGHIGFGVICGEQIIILLLSSIRSDIDSVDRTPPVFGPENTREHMWGLLDKRFDAFSGYLRFILEVVRVENQIAAVVLSCCSKELICLFINMRAPCLIRNGIEHDKRVRRRSLVAGVEVIHLIEVAHQHI